MKYKDAVKQSMEMLARDEKTVFIGYNITRGSRAYGTLNNIPLEKCLETPVAENLMAGLSIGMSLEGYNPVLIFERQDFMLNALDALVNHLDKIESLSKGEFIPKVIVRAIVGSKKPINPGPQHMQDFSKFFKEFLHFPVYDSQTSQEVIDNYIEALASKRPSMMIERKDLYERNN